MASIPMLATELEVLLPAWFIFCIGGLFDVGQKGSKVPCQGLFLTHLLQSFEWINCARHR